MIINEFYQLRELNSYQIAVELRKNHHCDSDVAVIAAWWVKHNEPPKNWAQYMSLAQHHMIKIRTSQQIVPQISERLFKLIMKNYEQNKIYSVSKSLLPL